MTKGAQRRLKRNVANSNFFVWASLVLVVLLAISMVVIVQLVLFKTKVAEAFPEAPKPDTWVTNGGINSIISDGTTTYIGGAFTYVGEYTGGTAAVSATDGTLATANAPRLSINSNAVESITPDGSGGWYVGGSVTLGNIGSTDTGNVIHFNSDGTLDTNFGPVQANSTVLDMIKIGNTLYLAGSFTLLQGVSRFSLGAVDATTGALNTSWIPNTLNNGNVNTIEYNAASNMIYAGGTFTQVDPPNAGTTNRTRLAAFDATTGDLDLSWNPVVCNTIFTLATNSDNSAVFVGGNFSGASAVNSNGGSCTAGSPGLATRNRIAAFDSANGSNVGTVQPWDPNISNGVVNSIILSNDGATAYFGGTFTGTVGGSTRTRLAAASANPATAAPTLAWAPTAANTVNEIVQKGTDIIAGGTFSAASGAARIRLAAFDASTAALSNSWKPAAINGDVNSLATDGTSVYIGGTMSSVTTHVRNRVAAFTSTLDLDTTFDPGTTLGTITTAGASSGGEVFRLVKSGSDLYVGGSFTTATLAAQNRIAKLNASTGSLTANWNPNPSNDVEDMAIDGTTLYVSGTLTSFTVTSGVCLADLGIAGTSVPRTRVASLKTDVNTTTQCVINSWNPGADGQVSALEQDTNYVYLGGDFVVSGGLTDEGIQKICKIAQADCAAGAASTTFTSPLTTGQVSTTTNMDMSADGSAIYIYYGANSTLGRDLAKIATSNGALDANWFPGVNNVNNTANAITVDSANNKVYIGGLFTTIGGQSRQRGAEVDATNGTVASWNPGYNQAVLDYRVSGNLLFAGGDFTETGRSATYLENRTNFAGYSTNTIQFTDTTSAGGEALTPANIEVSLASTDASNTTVNYTVTGGTASGSGVDYTLANGTATVTAGNLTTNIPITIVNDGDDESDETIEITLSSPSSNATLGSNTVHTYTIQDNDTVAVTITESSSSTDITEAGGTDTYTVVLASQPSASVDVAVTGDTQASGTPTPLTFTTVNWSTPQTVTVSAANDAIAEGAHTGTLTHAATSADGAYNGISIASVTANITDNDTAAVTINETGGSTDVSEAGVTDTYSVVLTSEPTSQVDITLGFNAQLNATPSPLTFTTGNWNTPQLVTVSAINDAAQEGDHSADVTHTAASSDPNYNGISIANVTANIADNDTPEVTITESGGSTQVTEGSTTDSYSVALATQPSDTVTVNISGDAQVTPSQSSLTFTTGNWNTPQDVTATPVNDAVAEGLHSGTITHSATSTDGNYNGITIDDVVVSITDNDSPGVSIVESGGGTTATEGGAGDSYTVVLLTQPTANVSIALSPNGEVTAGPTPLTFTNGNWNTPQTVNVSAVNDAVADPSDLGLITHAATSGDGNYNGISITDVTVSITDNDTAGITISESGGSTTVTEGGATDSYTVVLTSEPTANVVVTLTPDSEVGATPSPITFTNVNWNTPQTVTVSAIDDQVAEGAHLGSIDQAVASGDGNYNGFSLSDITVSLTDNDTAGVTITQSGGTTQAAEGGSGDSYTVVLTSEPTSNVSIAVNSDSQVGATPSPLTFTNVNWSTPQTVTVAAVDDDVAEGNHVGIVSHAATSSDGMYNGIGISSVSTTLSDNDVASIFVTESSGSTDVTEGGASDTYTVVLTSEPTDDVQVTLSHGDDVDSTPSSLLFSSVDWDVPQTVTVIAVDDEAVEGTHNDVIQHNAISDDTTYSGMAIDDVVVTITDDDTTPGGGGNNTANNAPTPPLPSEPQEPEEELVTQIGGSSIRELSIAISMERFQEPCSANGAVIANQFTAVDAYTGGSFATQNMYDMMVTDGQNMSADTMVELNRALCNKGKPIYLLGGIRVLLPELEEQLKEAGWSNVSRFAGENRRRTAELIGESVAEHNPLGSVTNMILVEDSELIDGISSGSAASVQIRGETLPIMINVRGSRVLDATVEHYVTNHKIRTVHIVGGERAIPFEIEDRLRAIMPSIEIIRYAGLDRFATNQAVNDAFFRDPTAAVAVRGDRPGIPGASVTGSSAGADTLVTALLGNTLAGQDESPIVLVTDAIVPDPTVNYLRQHADSITHLDIVADFNALSQAVVDELTALIQ